MSPVLKAALAWAAAILAAAGVCAAIAGAAAGWACAALGFAGLLAYYVWHLARLARWLRDTSAMPVPEATGSWDVVLATLHRHERDHARRESALAQALGRFRRAAQALPEGVVILDGKNRIEWCNDKAAVMLNLDAVKDLRRPVADLVRAPDFVEYLASDATEELVLSSKAGSVLALKLIPYDETQKLLLCRDVTQSERVEIMRRDFVANVSHELRTPLTVLVGFLETVRELKLDPQRVRDYVGMMREQAARMQRIIEDLLALSVLESAPPPPEARINVETLLRRIRVDGEALSAGRHTIEIDCASGADLVGSEQELTSALGNLVSNAVRYTPEGGRIRLLWREGAEGASFSVEDTGPGIAPEHIPRLTERFYRVDRSRSRETGGTGLGLAIAKHALARHQAQLEIESKPGAGSRFTARFPAKRLLFSDPAGSESTPQQR